MTPSFLAALVLASIVASARQTPPEGEPDRRCHIHGRVVDEDGAPVVGARVVASGWGANEQRVELYGLPTQWTDPEVLTGANGAFELRFVPPQAFQFTLEVQHDAFADLGWRWSQIAQGEVRAQGDVTLVRPGVIEGHVESSLGDLLVEQWFVVATLESQLMHHAGISTKHCAIDRATGRFRFDDLPPGDVSLFAMRGTGERSAQSWLTTTARAMTNAVLIYDGPDLARRILVRISSSGVAGVAASQLTAGSLRAVAADGVVHPFGRISNRGWEYCSGDLPPGEYRVEVEDPGFERWEKSGVRPGEMVHVRLGGRARLRATVLGPDGAPVSSYRLTIQQTAPFRTSHVEELQSAGSPPPSDGVHRGLLEGSYDVCVTVEGLGEHRISIADLTADDTYELVARLAPLMRLRGRVVFDDGSPVKGGTVQVTLGDVPGHDNADSSLVSTTVGGRYVTVPFRDASGSLDAEGAFDLAEIAAAPAVVRVLLGDWIRHDLQVDLAVIERPLVITLPRLGSVQGPVLFSGDRPKGELLVRPAQEFHEWRDAGGSDSTQSGAVNSEGFYRLGPLLAGQRELELIAVERVREGSDGLDDESFAISTRTLECVRVDVAAGAPTPYHFDLAFKRPTTRAAFSFMLAGMPLAQPLTLELVPLERFDAEGRERKGAYGWREGDRCVVDSVAAGLYRSTIMYPGLWSHTVADPVEVTVDQVASGAVPCFDIDLPLVRRDLRVLAADGTPCPSSTVWIGPTTNDGPGALFLTSAAGVLTLTLPSGTYQCRAGGRDPENPAHLRTTDFEWRAGEGTIEVRLPAH